MLRVRTTGFCLGRLMVASYGFDENLRLSRLKDGDRVIYYTYDYAGRLAEKTFLNGMKSSYRYDNKGQITELRHEDKEGMLDRYFYRYDLLGNKTGITRERRGLEEESGAYGYGYDAIGRLESVTRDGNPLRYYQYDAFGNRTGLTEKGQETAYAYNALNQLVSKRDDMGETSYQYDRRGNLTRAVRGGEFLHQYTYGTLNRLERAVNGKGEAASYQYNGLGYRVGKTEGKIRPEAVAQLEERLDPLKQLKALEPAPEKTIRYTIDLTRGYHNLLEKEENQRSQVYLWDGNAAGFYDEGVESPRYYLQDELGSPLRIEGEEGSLKESYGYDEFGCDLYQNQGRLQPFGYTGYQYDGVAGTYFAQAREYKREAGRFISEDLIAGFADMPFSMNRYGYCFNNGMVLMDLDGAWPSWNDIGNSLKEFFNSNIYGEETKYVNTSNLGDEFGGIYTSASNVSTIKSEQYQGSIFKKTTYIDGTENTIRTKWSINVPTIQLGDGKSIGIPASVGLFGGAVERHTI